ncbi:MAG TPA: hypothetical protein VHY08_23100, partial [Bacillota bacterium]|nr:hypothetical protein [Bacillota bacterium]
NPATLFIFVTAPPLRYDTSSNENAHRARVFNDWLKNDWLSSYNSANPGLNNVAVFDWFNILAYADDSFIISNTLLSVKRITRPYSIRTNITNREAAFEHNYTVDARRTIMGFNFAKIIIKPINPMVHISIIPRSFS